MSRREYMRAYMRARRRPDLYTFTRRVRELRAIDPSREDEARRRAAEKSSRMLLKRINALLKRRQAEMGA